MCEGVLGGSIELSVPLFGSPKTPKRLRGEVRLWTCQEHGLELDKPQFESFQHLLAGWPFVHYFTSLTLRCLICKGGTIRPISQSCHEDQCDVYRYIAWFLGQSQFPVELQLSLSGMHWGQVMRMMEEINFFLLWAEQPTFSGSTGQLRASHIQKVTNRNSSDITLFEEWLKIKEEEAGGSGVGGSLVSVFISLQGFSREEVALFQRWWVE